MSPAVRILAVEDHPLMRIGMVALLEREGMAVVAVATCAEAIEALRAGAIDVALLDLHLPDASGVGAVERLGAAAPRVPIVVFSVDASADQVRDAIRAGASGYLPKSVPTGQLVAALRAAAAGLAALAPTQLASLVNVVETADSGPRTTPPAVPPGQPTDPWPADEPGGPGAMPGSPGTVPGRISGQRTRDSLSTRELEFLRYLAEGYTNKEIARVMVLAEDTVKKGVQTLIAKLGATDRTHAVVLALRASLIV